MFLFSWEFLRWVRWKLVLPLAVSWRCHGATLVGPRRVEQGMMKMQSTAAKGVAALNAARRVERCAALGVLFRGEVFQGDGLFLGTCGLFRFHGDSVFFGFVVMTC